MEIKIVIGEDEKEYTVMSYTPIKFVDAMNELGLNFYRPCGGIGKCFNCAIRFVYGAPEMTAYDENGLDFNDMRNGYRMGCQCIIDKDCKIQVPKALVSPIISPVSDSGSEEEIDYKKTAIAIDIGTTTIAIAIVEAATGRILRQYALTNSQLKYGADVMTRVKAAMEGHAKELQNCVRDDLIGFGKNFQGDIMHTQRIVFAANSIMTHLFLGYTVDGFAASPFIPYTLDAIKFVESKREVYFMPSISPFVGGDIVSGLYHINKLSAGDTFLFVDLGTNAEIVLYNGSQYLVASASAGPALEGAGLSCGTASVRGAINHLSIINGQCKYTTIGDEAPIGICGSGVIDTIHELHRGGLIDDGGLFVPEYDEGYPIAPGITMTPEDVQAVLLAKSAVYSGIQVLFQEAGLDSWDEIGHLYVAGGLGSAVSVWAAAGIGIFPKQLIEKFQSVGNTSLLGAIDFIADSDEKALEAIRQQSRQVELANHPAFEALFLDNLRL
ncbi:MAG: ASKHA domain-containing protein [Pseudobutyrivibrio sp.]|nr:ASKHA domain-containing protein [Pseudobutyrivibrio sp.]